jgi:hypothetical protein
MKRLHAIIVLGLVLLVACTKEQIPPGLILKDPIVIIDTTVKADTTYLLSSIPAQQVKRVLFEEATGVLCANCPDGAKILRDLRSLYPDRIISASVYSKFLNDFQAPALYDFNSQYAQDLVVFLGGDPSKPSSAIDRLPTGTSYPYFFSKALWASKMDEIKDKKTPVNIDLSVASTGTENEYLVSSKITYTEASTDNLAISLYLLEDGVVDFQDSSSVEVHDYEHNHILRKIITPTSGSVFLSSLSTKEAGRVFEKYTKFVLPSTVLNKANCHVICFVHKTGSSREVLHVVETHL